MRQPQGGQAGAQGPWLFGVRHHGPGSARSVRAALDAVQPGAVLIEGPPEADELAHLAADMDMRPPVALLAHATDDPGRSAFWPFAEFSPEWVALRWALDRGVPVHFIDLPATHTLALRAADEAEGDDAGGTDDTGGEKAEEAGKEEQPARPHPEALRVDPLAVLADAAGYDDPERWWEDVVEHRGGTGPGAEDDAGEAALASFRALGEAMGALREEFGDGGHTRDLVREAHMRVRLKAARKEHGDSVAVICGAWHVPALASRTTLTADRALLKGLPKVKTGLTWVPWTHRRLARAGGYGAGIASPGWYGHLFSAPDRPVERWLTKVAGLLREEGRQVSSAHVIEAVRLAGALATLRGRPLAGLTETTDAIRSVLCEGSDVPLALIEDRLTVGDVLGEVPAAAPAVPLQRDLERLQRSLRFKPEAADREIDLDLRKENDAARSRLLHRLSLLRVDWGTPAAARSGTGTFRESWRLSWQPELAVRVAEAGVWGTTVASAATVKARSDATSATHLADITALAELCLRAELSEALPDVMRALADRAALDTDVGHLAQALPALVRSVRYGDVRGTDTAALAEVAAGLAERVFVGLPPACTGLDTDGAQELRRQIEAVHTAVGLLADTAAAQVDGAGLRQRWRAVLRNIADRESAPGLVRGRAVRLLLDEGTLDEDAVARRMGLALSPGTPPPDAAAWIEGFLGGAAGGGMLLVHDERLRQLLDTWLASVPATAFTDVLPLLRRTFSAYETGVRRTLGELVRRGKPAAGSPVPGRPAAPAPPNGRWSATRTRWSAAATPGTLATTGRSPPSTPTPWTCAWSAATRTPSPSRPGTSANSAW
ncbi:DUF5682 family protein [Streptomyces albidoflavus]|uniref:DUF5682 family protein n=1 Tax=Streptomyces albidoflavus TaxID=1886 RepID=UPI00211D0762|nr:DUF5682 family protein [Streptomyces albidoflavus]